MTTDISFVGLALASSLVLVAVLLSIRQQLGLERQILWASTRALVQLLIVGVVLAFLLQPGRSLWWSVAWVLLMLPFAADVVARRAPEVPRVSQALPCRVQRHVAGDPRLAVRTASDPS